jgi:hypothetical protein
MSCSPHHNLDASWDTSTNGVGSSAQHRLIEQWSNDAVARAIPILVLTLALTGCTPTEQAPPPAEVQAPPPTTSASAQPTTPRLPPLDSGVVFRLHIDSSRAGHVAVILETNLPDETEVMLGLERRRSADNPMSASAVVHGGIAREDRFGGDEPLPVGEYEADATMPYPFRQSARVQAIIGPNGEALRSPLLKHGKLGVTIHSSVRFMVGGRYAGAVAAKEWDEAVAEVRAMLTATTDLVARGRAMESLRDPTNLTGLRECGARMRRNLAEHEGLDRRAVALPRATPALGDLYMALSSARMCVTCREDAMRSCRETDTQVGEALRALQSAQRERLRE